MVDPARLQSILEKVRSEEGFLQALLRDGLGWNIDQETVSLDDISFEWTEEELKASGLTRKLVDGCVRQIRPLTKNQPIGIFLLEFSNPEVFTKSRGMVTPLREVLRGLAPKRGRDSNLPAWKADDLLFICTHAWRHFSFVHFAQPKDGRQARMTSFGWGPETQGRTVLEHNLPHLKWPDTPGDSAAWRAQWLRAFDKEALTKRFFATFTGLYGQVKTDIASVKKYADEADAKALLLVNRLLFLYFIQQKGWLAGQRDFLIREFDARHRAKPAATTFYAKFLFPLFERLAMPDCLDPRFESVPFLNGGLFEIDGTQADGDLRITNATFAALFDELFERFNFTITEDTPLDVEVAIDPEMLGKIFEELVTGRHESGAYYTPRPIVSFMCREALKGYLGGGEAVERFVDGHDAKALSNPEEVLEKLRQVRVCDPACGSGAYLVGMLHELMALRRALFVSSQIDQKNNYKKKLEIIQRNLYGVDIDPVAVNIARLRLWLSLVIEFDGPKPDPLPNLDFKIEEGNSITGPDPTDSLRDIDVFDHELIDEFERKKSEFMRKNVYGDKRDLKIELEAIRQKLRELARRRGCAEGFDWAIEFAEVFGEQSKPGFDIILANPPYISALEFKRNYPEEDRKTLNRLYASARGAYDIYILFFERAIQCIRDRGHLCFITPNKYLSASYALALRDYLVKNASLKAIVDLSRIPVFSSASVYPVLSLIEKSPQKNSPVVRLLQPLSRMESEFNPDMFGEIFLPSEMLNLLPDHIWGFLLSGKASLLKKMIEGSLPLERLFEVNATSTASEAEEYGNFISNKSGKAFIRLVNTGTIDSYRCLWGEKELTHGGKKYKTPYLDLHTVGSRRLKMYQSPKVIFAKMAKSCEAFCDSSGEYASVNTNCVYNAKSKMSLAYACGFCNSRIFMFLYNQFFGALRMSGGYYQFQAPQIRVIPVRMPSGVQHSRISSLALEAETCDDKRLCAINNEIDQVLYDIYELSPEEIVSLKEPD